MYRITCCRKCKKHNNRMYKGCFVKEFKTLSEFVNFFNKSHNRLFFPYFLKELSRKESYIVYKKINSITKKDV